MTSIPISKIEKKDENEVTFVYPTITKCTYPNNYFMCTSMTFLTVSPPASRPGSWFKFSSSSILLLATFHGALRSLIGSTSRGPTTPNPCKCRQSIKEVHENSASSTYPKCRRPIPEPAQVYACMGQYINHTKQGLILDYQLLVPSGGRSDMFQYFSTILYVFYFCRSVLVFD